MTRGRQCVDTERRPSDGERVERRRRRRVDGARLGRATPPVPGGGGAAGPGAARRDLERRRARLRGCRRARPTSPSATDGAGQRRRPPGQDERTDAVHGGRPTRHERRRAVAAAPRRGEQRRRSPSRVEPAGAPTSSAAPDGPPRTGPVGRHVPGLVAKSRPAIAATAGRDERRRPSAVTATASIAVAPQPGGAAGEGGERRRGSTTTRGPPRRTAPGRADHARSAVPAPGPVATASASGPAPAPRAGRRGSRSRPRRCSTASGEKRSSSLGRTPTSDGSRRHARATSPPLSATPGGVTSDQCERPGRGVEELPEGVVRVARAPPWAATTQEPLARRDGARSGAVGGAPRRVGRGPARRPAQAGRRAGPTSERRPPDRGAPGDAPPRPTGPHRMEDAGRSCSSSSVENDERVRWSGRGRRSARPARAPVRR